MLGNVNAQAHQLIIDDAPAGGDVDVVCSGNPVIGLPRFASADHVIDRLLTHCSFGVQAVGHGFSCCQCR